MGNLRPNYATMKLIIGRAGNLLKSMSLQPLWLRGDSYSQISYYKDITLCIIPKLRKLFS